MTNTMQLPEPPLPRPVQDRPAPLIWFERILLVEELPLHGKLIREIPFRRGLNIIRTEERTDADVKTVGHSVGKTLLVRLLRYCLGERTYGTAKQHAAIARAYEDGWVLAKVHVAGHSWVVARPLGLNDDQEFAATGTDFGLVRSESDHRQPFRVFTEAIEAATAPAFNSLTLPHTSPPRRGRWLDLLAWVARDQNCRYRHHHEWRDPDSESGTGQLRLEGAGFVIRMVMGLFAAGEEDVILKHRELLDKKARLESERDQLRLFHDMSTQQLRREVTVDPLLQQPDLFTQSAAERATERLRQYKSLLEDIRTKNQAGKALQALQMAEATMLAHETAHARVDGMIQARQAELDSKRSDAEGAATQRLELLGTQFCHFYNTRDQAFEDGCPGKTAQPVEDSSPILGDEIQRLELRLDDLKQQLAAADEQVRISRVAAGSVRDQWKAAADEERRHVTQLGLRIGRQGELRRMALRAKKSWLRHAALQSDVESIEKKIEESRLIQESARATLNRDRIRLSQAFDFALKRLVSDAAGGSIDIDAKGVRPEPSDDVPTGGEAISTSATVLSFDLACVISSMCGVGHFPRLLIHDSPREADMEQQMYHALFKFMVELESLFEDREPSFQYIVTTTTQPPRDLRGAPYVRETLHGRDENGLLFRKRLF